MAVGYSKYNSGIFLVMLRKVAKNPRIDGVEIKARIEDPNYESRALPLHQLATINFFLFYILSLCVSLSFLLSSYRQVWPFLGSQDLKKKKLHCSHWFALRFISCPPFLISPIIFPQQLYLLP